MSTHPQMESTIPTLNIGTIKLDELIRIFGDDFLNDQLPMMGKHHPDPILIVRVEIRKPRIREDRGRFGLSK
jgi:hypothetical protein